MNIITSLTRSSGIIICLALALSSGRAGAAVFQTFTDHNAFIAATGASSASGPIPNLGKVANVGGEVVLGNVGFSVAAPSIDLWFGRGSGLDWTGLLAGNEIAIGERENLNARFTAPVFAAGFDFVEPSCASGCTHSSFTIALLDAGNQVVGSFPFSAPQDSAQFFGVWADTPFSQMQIRETGNPDSANEYFGQFYSSHTVLPEPSAFLSTMSGLLTLGVVVFASRSRKAARLPA